MSSHSTKAGLVPVVLVAITVAAVIIAAAAGLSGVPQDRAAASPDTGRSTAAAHDSFATVVAGAVPASARTRMMPSTIGRGALNKSRVSPAQVLGLGPWKKAKVSWYGPGFYGNHMAGGGRLRRDSMVVAHKTMKFGTRILFTYKGKSVIAVVRDRGPYVSGRVFDLGPGTAKALGFQGVGTVKYRIIK